MPFQSYNSLQNEVEKLVTMKDTFMTMYNQQPSPYLTRNDKINRLTQLHKMAKILKKDTEFFNRALTMSHTVGIIDNEQALKIRMSLNFPRKSIGTIDTYITDIEYQVKQLQEETS